MYSTLLTNLENGIFTITVNRPDKLNALNRMVLEELREATQKVYEDKDIKAAIITGQGAKAFVAGADIAEFVEVKDDQGAYLAGVGQEIFFRIETSPKPFVAAVNGFALGGGCELAMACHFRLASDNAKFGQPEVNLGLVPGYGGTQRLTQLVGKGRAMEWTMTGNVISAADALQWGLVNHVTAPGELLTAAIDILRLINTKAPRAISKVIELINLAAYGSEGGLQQEIDAFGMLFDTKDAKEGAAAFLEKRKAVFTGT